MKPDESFLLKKMLLNAYKIIKSYWRTEQILTNSSLHLKPVKVVKKNI